MPPVGRAVFAVLIKLRATPLETQGPFPSVAQDGGQYKQNCLQKQQLRLRAVGARKGGNAARDAAGSGSLPPPGGRIAARQRATTSIAMERFFSSS
jgi:hypothetical protein